MPKIDLAKQLSAQIQTQQYSDIIITCNLILKKDPKNNAALYQKAKAYLELKEFSKAIVAYEEHIKFYPNNEASAYCELAYAYEQKREYQKAKENYGIAKEKHTVFKNAIEGYARVTTLITDELQTARITPLEEKDFVFVGEEKKSNKNEEEGDLLKQKQQVCQLFNHRLYIILENFFTNAKTSSIKIFQAEATSQISTGSKIANAATNLVNPPIGILINFASTLASTVTQEQQLQHLASLGNLLTREEAEEIAKIVADEITRRYAHSLSRINIYDFNKSNANTLLVKLELVENDILQPLVNFALVKVVEYVFDRKQPFSKETLADDLIKTICKATPTLSDQFKKKFGLGELTTYDNVTFNASDFFSAAGIMLPNQDTFETYVNQSTNPKVYGYRLGTLEEIHEKSQNFQSELTPARSGIYPELFEHYFVAKPKEENVKQLKQKVEELTLKNQNLEEKQTVLEQENQQLKEEMNQMKKQMEQFQKFMEEQLSTAPKATFG